MKWTPHAWRRTSRVALTLVLALTTLGADALFSQGRQNERGRRIVTVDGREVVEGEVIVRYRSETGPVERERAEFYADSEGSEAIGRRGARRMRSRMMSTRQMLAALRANPDVEFAEPNFIIRALAMPNDPSFGALWGLLNTGQTIDGQPGVPGADIGAVAAWDISTGSRANVVAIIDTGIDFNHPDLAANMFSAPRQFTVSLGSGMVTCAAGTHGFNALNNTCIASDDSGHGTHVAGIVGAVGNNNVGVTGVNWTANLMAIKVLDASGAGTTSDAIKGIDFLIKVKAELGADANVRVLNASWGGGAFSQALSQQIEAANTANMLFVAAAGTEGNNNDVTPHYPASAPSGNVISVASADNTGALASFSNYGAASVHLAAPGASTWSTVLNNGYAYLSGTSMAAPHVAGAAALVLSVCPSNTATLKSRLLAGVDPHASLVSTTISGGRLNVGTVLQSCLATLHATISGATITATVGNASGNAQDWLALYCPASSGNSSYIDWKYLNGSQTAPASGLTSATVTFQSPTQAGTNCNVRLFAGSHVVATSETVGYAAQPSLSIGDVSITEGNSGTSTATFTITLAPVNTTQIVTVNYGTANGSATLANNDYVAAGGTATFPSGVSTQTFTVTIQGDTAQESTETFVVNLSAATNAVIGDAQATGTITNDDGQTGPAVNVSTPNVAPGGTISFSVVNGPANRGDWVGLFNVNAPDGTYLQWQYLNGSQTAPASGLANASLQFTAPTTPGSYDVRLFAPTRIARSSAINVGSQPTLTIGDVSIAEGNSGTSLATFTVSLSPVNSSQTVTVAYATANGSATTANSDYVAANGTVTFAPGVSSQTFAVTIQGDTAQESTETFMVNLSGATNAVIGDAQAIGTITNDDGAAGPSITVSTPNVSPGGTISFSVANGPANAGDWVGLFNVNAPDNTYLQWKYLNGAQTAPSSGLANASLQFTAPTTPGTYDVRLFAPTRIARSSPINVGTQSVLSIGDVSVSEGGSGTSLATFTVTMSPLNSSQTVTVNYATADGTATTAGNDYAAASGTLSFAPSTATRTFTVTVQGDTIQESNEAFVVNLSGVTNAVIGDGQATGTITNDDTAAAQATLSIGDVSITEGNSGTSLATFTVTLSPVNATQTVTVGYATADGSATTANSDYAAASGTASFAPGVSTQTFTVTIQGDTAQESNESYVVNLSNATNALIGDAQATGTITNDDTPTGPAVNVASTNVAPGAAISFTVANGPANAGDWVGLFNVSAPDNIYLQWQYLNGSQTAPSSGLANASLQFTAPTTPGSYNVRLFAPSRIAQSSAVTVGTQPTLNIGDVSLTEGNSGTSLATFTITLSPVNSSQTVTAAYTTANGTATTANNDYVAASGTVTFAPGVSTQTLSVTIQGDTNQEGNETFAVNLSGATNAVIGDGQGIGTITTDDAVSGTAITLDSTTVTVGSVINFQVWNGPRNAADWVGFFQASAADSTYQRWMYLNGQTTPPASGVANASLQWMAPTTPGTYNIRLFANNGYTKLATSATITVVP